MSRTTPTRLPVSRCEPQLRAALDAFWARRDSRRGRGDPDSPPLDLSVWDCSGDKQEAPPVCPGEASTDLHPIQAGSSGCKQER